MPCPAPVYRLYSLFLRLTLPLILLLSGPQGFGQKGQTEAMKQVEQAIEISAPAVRVLVEDFYEEYKRKVVAGADSIIRLSDETRVIKNALLWKISALSSIQQALFISDPFIGLTEEATLIFQMEHFFRTGAGSEAFGEYQPIAIRVCEGLIEKMKASASNLSENRDVEVGVQYLQNFATDNPIKNMYFERPSSLPSLVDIIGQDGAGIGKITQSLEQNLALLTFSINSSILQLSDQLIWQAELAAYELTDKVELPKGIDATFQNKLARLDTLSNQLSKVLSVAEATPTLVNEQRTLLTSDLQRERAIILASIRYERQEVIDDLKIEMDSILDKITSERIAALTYLNALTNEQIDHSFDRLDKLVQRTLLQIGLFLGILALLIGLGFLFLRRR